MRRMHALSFRWTGRCNTGAAQFCTPCRVPLTSATSPPATKGYMWPPHACVPWPKALGCAAAQHWGCLLPKHVHPDELMILARSWHICAALGCDNIRMQGAPAHVNVMTVARPDPAQVRL
eukprot:365742-Chlamydomonas_euryale.AAC.11